MKLTKLQSKLHGEALQLLSKKRLSAEEIDFVFENYHPGALSNITTGGQFFTPADMAWDAACYQAGEGSVVDACAGIGILAHSLHLHSFGKVKLTCVEKNPEFVAAGRKLVPDAKWICGDVFEILPKLKPFESAISNPPFGAIVKTKSVNFPSSAHFAVMELLLQRTQLGAIVIIPANDHSQSDSCGQKTPGNNYRKLRALYPGAELEPGPFDTCRYEFKEAKPNVQICNLFFDAVEEAPFRAC